MILAQLVVEDAKRSSKQEHKFLNQTLPVAGAIHKALLLPFPGQAGDDRCDRSLAHVKQPPSVSLEKWDSKFQSVIKHTHLTISLFVPRNPPRNN